MTTGLQIYVFYNATSTSVWAFLTQQGCIMPPVFQQTQSLISKGIAS